MVFLQLIEASRFLGYVGKQPGMYRCLRALMCGS